MRSRIIWYIVIGLFVGIQLVPSGRPEVVDDNPNDLLSNHQLPEHTASLLRNACYDCHSNESIYPWYAYVAPVSWLVSRDVRLGRENLNLSDWNSFSKGEKLKYLDGMAVEVGDGQMPMIIYPLTHPEAKLSREDREAFVEWTETFAEQLFSK